MYPSAHPSGILIENSLETADIILSIKGLYIGVRKIFGKIGTVALTLMAVLLLRILLWFLKKRLQKDFPSKVKISAENYKILKKNQEDIEPKIAALIKIKDTNIKNVPWVLHGSFRQIRSIISLIENRNNSLNQELILLNEAKTSDKNFRVVRESELWKMRTPHYEYRL